ncbi:MAG: hypothetical protein AB8B51_17800 [Sedimentitalea sp.]
MEIVDSPDGVEADWEGLAMFVAVAKGIVEQDAGGVAAAPLTIAKSELPEEASLGLAVSWAPERTPWFPQ